MSSKNNSEDDYINKLRILLNNDDNENVLDEGFYEWEVEDWDDLRIFEVSPIFNIGNYAWKIALLPNGYSDGNDCYVSLHLANHDVDKDDTLDIYGSFVFSMRNYKDYSYYITDYTKSIECFNMNNNEHHFPKFIKQKDVFKKNKKTGKTLVENNKVMIGVYLRVYDK